jgi:hypothetical protein
LEDIRYLNIRSKLLWNNRKDNESILILTQYFSCFFSIPDKLPRRHKLLLYACQFLIFYLSLTRVNRCNKVHLKNKVMSNETENTTVTAAEEALNAAIANMSAALAAEPRAASAVFPDSTMRAIINLVNQAKTYFANYDTPLTATDRRRLFGTGFKYTGFIEAACEGAEVNPHLLPAYMPVTRFKEDLEDYTRKHSLYLITDQFSREVWDSLLSSGDNACRDALDYYNSVKEASRRRVTGAEAEYLRLKTFFKKSKPHSNQPTETEVARRPRPASRHKGRPRGSGKQAPRSFRRRTEGHRRGTQRSRGNQEDNRSASEAIICSREQYIYPRSDIFYPRDSNDYYPFCANHP